MKNIMITLLVSLVCTNVFAGGACFQSQGYWEPIAADCVAQIKERSNEKSYASYRATSWQQCFQDAIKLSKTYALKENTLNFTDWTFKEDDQEVVVTKYKTTIKGLSQSGTVDAWTNPTIQKTDDQRYFVAGKNFWECVVNFADASGQTESEVVAQVKTRGQNQTQVLTNGVYNPYLVFAQNSVAAESGCKLKAAIELVKSANFEKAIYSTTDSTSFVTSLAFMARSSKVITQDQAEDLLTNKNIVVSKGK